MVDDAPTLHREPSAVNVAGLNVDRYRSSAPNGPPVVVVHGVMDRASGFRRMIRHLGDRDVLAYDRRGYAGSIGVAPSSRITDHVTDLLAICELFDEPPLLVGHSQGALIALHALAATAGEGGLRGAVIWEPPAPWTEWYASPGDDLVDESPEVVVDRFMRTVLGDRLWERLPAGMRAERRLEGPALLADLAASRASDGEVDLSLIDTRVLVGHGTASEPRSQRAAIEAARGIRDSAVVVIEGAPHGVHLKDPLAFARVIRGWPVAG